MKGNIVSVQLWGKEICRLQWAGGYRQGFGKIGAVVSFNPDYVTYGWDLDPLGPFNSSMYFVRKGMSDWCRATEYEGLPRFLSGSLPDDWGNSVFSAWVEQKKLRHSDITSVDKLAYIGSRGMGALEFAPALYKGLTEESAVEIEELYKLASQILASRDGVSINLSDKPGIEDLMAVGMSAGGQHPKAIIAINWQTGEVKSGQFLLPEAFTQYILKFKDFPTWPGAEVEYAYYKVASLCGISMEQCRLIDIGGQNHFLTERFDRKGGAKLHSATLHALNGPTASYEEIFSVCRRLRLPYHDFEQLFRRVVFNYLAGVCDDHDKNFSFILSPDGRWRLSPAYDVTFNVNLLNKFIGDRHAMSAAGQNRRLTKAQFLSLAQDADIKNGEHIVYETATTLSGIGTILTDLGVSSNIVQVITQHIDRQIEAL